MKGYKLFIYCLFFIAISLELKGQNSGQTNFSESVTLAEAYINLSLTETYFDKLSIDRIYKILPYEESELGTLKNKKFNRQNSNLYNFSYSLLNFNKTKLLFRNKKEITRDELVAWKNTLGLANRYYQKSLTKPLFTSPDTSLHELINFNEDSKNQLAQSITDLSIQFTPYFNNDIYPEFKELFKDVKDSNNYNFLKLWGLAANYNLSLEFSILNSLDFKIFPYLKPSSGDIIYELDLKHDLISRYSQLKYIASNQNSKTFNNGQIRILFDSYNRFIQDLKKEKDEFILKELNSEECETLLKELQIKYPNYSAYMLKKTEELVGADSDGDGVADHDDIQYFFPNPAPLPSDSLTVADFKPSFTTLGQVDMHLSGLLNDCL